MLFYDRYNQNVVGKLFWVYALTIIIIDGLLANKYQIISLGLIFLIAYNSYKRRIRIKILFVGIGMIILLFLVLFEFVYQEMYGITIDMIYNIYQMNIPREFEILTQPYLYVAFNYDNLYNFLSNSHDSFYGLKTLNGFLSIVGIDQFYLSTQQLISSEWHSILTIESLTAGTMFEDPAQDGDIPFMILFTFLCGIWSSASYKKFIYNRGFFAFFMFASISCAIFMSFFYNAFTSKITLLNLLAAYCINIVLNKTSKARSI